MSTQAQALAMMEVVEHYECKIKALTDALAQNSHMLGMCAELIGDGAHLGKVVFIHEQIAANREAVKTATQ